MRIVDRKTFLAMPAGTIYSKGERWAFSDLCIKGDSFGNDWAYCNPAWVEAHDSGEAFDRLEAMLETGVSYPGEQHHGRDGCFDDKAIFMVFERADLEWLRGQIDAAIATTPAPTD